MTVLATLLRLYRLIALGFVGAVVLVTVVGDALLSRFEVVPYSLWMTVAATGVKYWLGVVGVMLVTLHLRPFVAAGVTRRAYLRGAGLFVLTAAAGLTVLVVAGHAIEGAILPRAASYPVLTGGHVVPELARVFVTMLAYVATGAAITAGFYRWGPRLGIPLMIPALVPVLLAEGLLGLGPYGAAVARLLPYGLALAVTLVAAGLVVAMGERELRNAAIRPGTT
jgi:hypothetical protein